MATTPGCTLTFTLVDGSGNPIEGAVQLTLVNFGTLIPSVANTAILAQQVYTAQADSSGVGSITFWGNYQLNAPNSYYQISVFGVDASGELQTGASSTSAYQFTTSGTLDLSNIVPLNYFAGVPLPVYPTSGVILTNPPASQTIHTYPLALPGIVSASANAASTGFIRMAESDTITWHNAGSPSGDFPLGINSLGQLTFNGVPVAMPGVDNAFTGNNSFSGSSTFSGPIASTGTNSFTGSSAFNVITVASLSATSFEGVQYADQFAGADIGAQVNAAMAALGATGGTVYIPAGAYNFSTTIDIVTNVQLVGAGSCATMLYYTGTTTALILHIAGPPYDPYMNGLLRGFTITGYGNTNNHKRGIWHIDTIGTTYDDLVVSHFNEVGDQGICFDNQALFSERISLRKLSILDNTIGFVFQNSNSGDPGASNSFGYHRWSEVHFQVNAGQYGIFCNGTNQGLLIYNGNIGFSANVADQTGTVMALVGAAEMINCEFSIFAETTTNPETVATGIYVDPNSAFTGWGEVQMNSLSNSVQAGAIYLVNSYGFEGSATLGTNFDSLPLVFQGTYWNGAVAVTDTWTVQLDMGSGTVPISVLNLSHTGSGGAAYLQTPGLTTVNITSYGTITASGMVTGGNLACNAVTPSSGVPPGTVAFGETTGYGNGGNEAVEVHAKGSGSGPANPENIVNFLEVNVGGTLMWIPLML
jgi:hypothetical protein